jgi:anti-sigma factor RsiW
MNDLEEKLWDYIDGNCTADEQNAIKSLIAGDEEFRLKYEELLMLNRRFSAMELDEPPMAFTYNVIEAIRTERAQQPLKAAINKRIIWGIALFFILTLTVLLVYTIMNISWSSINVSTVNFKLPPVKNYLTRPVIQGFLFFDVVLALFLLDNYLRKKTLSKQI